MGPRCLHILLLAALSVAATPLPAQAQQSLSWQSIAPADLREEDRDAASMPAVDQDAGSGIEVDVYTENPRFSAAAAGPTAEWRLAAVEKPVPAGGSPPPEPMLVVGYDPELPIRQLAHDYLGDADLWPKILESSGLASIVDLKPGYKLKLPVSQVAAANQAIRLSHHEIERANQAGAQLFAPRMIASAIHSYDEALVRRTLGEWLSAFNFAQQSRTAAGEAYDVCLQNRDQAAEARLSDKQGLVEGQKPREPTWEERQRNALLIEEEKVRTLSDSTAQITFRDASRLRLNPNSQAVIQRLRVDPLTREEDTKVSLIEGDFYALLADSSERKRFEVEIPGVEARVDSGDFWVSNDGNGAKFTNYDTSPVRIAARGEAIVLGRNEGALVSSDQEPMRRLDVLLAPVPQGPPQDQPAIAGQVLLRWTAVAEATGYWIEIAKDPQFNQMVATERGFSQTQFEAGMLAPGIYHWRVSALDRFDLPGARSRTRRLEVRSDTEPPYLLIEQPRRAEIVRNGPVIVAGQSEPGVQLTINGSAVTVNDQGRFRYSVNPSEGDHVLAFHVTDQAGNETTGTRHFTYMPDRPAEITYAPQMRRLAPGHFVVNSSTLSLAGVTRQHAHLRVESEDGSALAATYADGEGRFRTSVSLPKAHQMLTLQVTLPSGFVTTAPLEVTVDRVAPKVYLDKPLPRLTTGASLQISGWLSETAKLHMNGREVTAGAGRRFEQRINLADGGNTIEIVATDTAGNVGLRRWVVQRDSAPPELIDHQVTIAANEGGAALQISIGARDASGLARIAPFTVDAGGAQASGYLRYDSASRRYRGGFDITGTKSANAELRQVTLTDRAGNTKIFSVEEAR